MNALTVLNLALGALLGLAYAYQFVFLVISYAKRKKAPPTDKHSRIAVLIAARNEERVIGNLINSLFSQDYPKECFDIFVVADNCTDKTKEHASRLGATVYERHNTEQVGKGYALEYLISSIKRDRGDNAYDAFLVFDADNTLEPNYITEMNKTLALGYDCVTSYRNSINYGDNWLSAGQGMCFLRDMVMLNRARMAVGGCCFVSGTGFIFTNELCRRFGGGWPFHTLTEDCEFTMYNAIHGSRMGYCDTAILYDEQTTRFSQSWSQRLRWCKGGIQVFVKYIRELLSGIFKGKFISCFDMSMCMAPAYIISVLATAINTLGAVISLALGTDPVSILVTLASAIAGIYAVFLCFSIPLTVSEWKRLRATPIKKILYAFTFPIFMGTFLPITCVALLKRQVKWKQIEHKAGK